MSTQDVETRTPPPDGEGAAVGKEDIAPKGVVKGSLEKTGDYVDERSSLVAAHKWFLFRNVPAETSWFQTLGFTAMALFGLQAITGIVLAMYYKPDPNTAFQSIEFITDTEIDILSEDLSQQFCKIFFYRFSNNNDIDSRICFIKYLSEKIMLRYFIDCFYYFPVNVVSVFIKTFLRSNVQQLKKC